MKKASTSKRYEFQSKLERITPEINYFHIPVPKKITAALGTTAAVPVLARVNGSKPFVISLYPLGGGKHCMRVKASVREEVGLVGGDRVKVEFTIRDHAKEVSLPRDLEKALRADGVFKDFEAMPNGQKSFMLRQIDAAAKPETRAKRIQAVLEEAHRRAENLALKTTQRPNFRVKLRP